MSDKIQIIDLHPSEADCYVCDATVLVRPRGPNFGLPIYEGDIVPDDYKGEWGGVTVCPTCYFLTRGVQSEQPGKLLPIYVVRRLKGERSTNCD